MSLCDRRKACVITEGASEGEGAYLGRSSARVLVRPPRGHGGDAPDSNLNAVVWSTKSAIDLQLLSAE